MGVRAHMRPTSRPAGSCKPRRPCVRKPCKRWCEPGARSQMLRRATGSGRVCSLDARSPQTFLPASAGTGAPRISSMRRSSILARSGIGVGSMRVRSRACLSNPASIFRPSSQVHHLWSTCRSCPCAAVCGGVDVGPITAYSNATPGSISGLSRDDSGPMHCRTQAYPRVVPNEGRT